MIGPAVMLTTALAVVAGPVIAQTAPSGLPVVSTVSSIGFAGGGGASIDPARAWEIPVSALDRGQSFFAEAASGSRGGSSMRQLAGGAVLGFGGSNVVGISLSWQGMTNLLDDPGFADAGLYIADWRTSLILARTAGHLGVGISGSFTTSQVFGTHARTLTLRPAVSWSARRVRLVMVGSGIGPPTTYTDDAGSRRLVQQPKQLTLAAGLAVVARRSLRVNLYLDYSQELKSRGLHTVAVAADVKLLETLTGRLGFAAQRGSANGSLQGAGIVLHVAAIELSYAFSPGLGTMDMAPRHHFGVTVGRCRVNSSC